MALHVRMNSLASSSCLHYALDNKVRNFQITTSDNMTLGKEEKGEQRIMYNLLLLLLQTGAWHILPSSYHLQHGLRDIQGVPETSVYEKALSDPKFETLVYFHGNAMNRAAPWRIDLYKVRDKSPFNVFLYC